MNDQAQFFSNCSEIESAIRDEDPAIFDRLFANQARDLQERIPAELDRYIQNCKFANRLPTLEGANKWILWMNPGHGVKAGWTIGPSKIDEKAEAERHHERLANFIKDSILHNSYGIRDLLESVIEGCAVASVIDAIERNRGGIRDAIRDTVFFGDNGPSATCCSDRKP